MFVQDLVIQDLSLRKKEEENKVGGRMPVLKTIGKTTLIP